MRILHDLDCGGTASGNGLDGELIFKQVNQSIIALDSETATILLPVVWRQWMRSELASRPRFFLIESNNESPIAGYRKIVGDQHYAWAECRYPALKWGRLSTLSPTSTPSAQMGHFAPCHTQT